MNNLNTIKLGRARNNFRTTQAKSQTGKCFYKVKATPSCITCTCHDFVYCRRKCEHLQATRYYLEIEKDTPNRKRYRKGPHNV